MQSHNPWGTFISQLESAAAVEKPKRGSYNPRPAGVIQPGSATAAVLDFLRSKPHAFFTHSQIQAATGKTKVAIDWGLIYLKSQGLVEVTSDPRSERYHRYRMARSE